HVALVRRVGARVLQWAVGNQGVEHPGRLEKFDEERRLAKRRKWCFGIPLHMHPTGPAVQRHALGPGLPINRGLPTPAVSGNIAFCRAHAPDNEPNSSSRKPIKLPDLGSFTSPSFARVRLRCSRPARRMITAGLPICVIIAFSPLELSCTSKQAPGCTYSQHNAHDCANCEVKGARIEQNLKCVTHFSFFWC